MNSSSSAEAIITVIRWMSIRLMAAFVLCALLYGVYIAIFEWYPSRPKRVSSYAGIELLSKRDVVRYRLGRPVYVYNWPTPAEVKECEASNPNPWVCSSAQVFEGSTIKGEDLQNFDNWEWSFKEGGRLTVLFSRESGSVLEISCDWGNAFDYFVPPSFENSDIPSEEVLATPCPKIFSIGIGSTESQLINTLGRPSSDVIDKERLIKTLRFKNLNLEFELARERVEKVTVYTE